MSLWLEVGRGLAPCSSQGVSAGLGGIRSALQCLSTVDANQIGMFPRQKNLVRNPSNRGRRGGKDLLAEILVITPSELKKNK